MPLQYQHPSLIKKKKKDSQPVAVETKCKANQLGLLRNWSDCNYYSYCHSHYHEGGESGGGGGGVGGDDGGGGSGGALALS